MCDPNQNDRMIELLKSMVTNQDRQLGFAKERAARNDAAVIAKTVTKPKPQNPAALAAFKKGEIRDAIVRLNELLGLTPGWPFITTATMDALTKNHKDHFTSMAVKEAYENHGQIPF
jgi:hypothetical protein